MSTGPLVLAWLLPIPISSLILYRLSLPSTSLFLNPVLTIAWSLTFTATLLLPLDLAAAADAPADADPAYTPAIQGSWLATYWVTFIFSWLLLPLIQDSILDGHLTLLSKLRSALRASARFYLVALGVAVCVFVLLALTTDGVNIPHLLLAFGNTYGLLLALLLLGYGLVAVPRDLWQRASPSTMVERRYLLASSMDSDLFEAVWSLQDVELVCDTVSRRPETSIPEVEAFREEIRFRKEAGVADLVEVEGRRARRAGREPSSPRSSSSSAASSAASSSSHPADAPLLDPSCELTPSNLAALNKSLIAAQTDVRRAVRAFQVLVDETAYYESLSSLSPPEPIAPPPNSSAATHLLASLSNVSARLHYIFQAHARRATLKLSAGLLACLTVLVLWSELFMGLPVNLSPFGSWMSASRGSASLELLAVTPLLYMSFCVYSSLFKLRLFGRNGLKKRQSDGPSLCFAASYLVRMQFPLCYNYLLMLRYPASERTAFMTLMQSMDTVPLFGTSFSTYAPLLCVLLCFATLFNFYGRLLASMGVDTDDAILHGGDAEEKAAKVREGVTILRRALQAKQRGGDGPAAAGGGRGGGEQEMGINQTYSYSKV
jgi:hypothetical protein